MISGVSRTSRSCACGSDARALVKRQRHARIGSNDDQHRITHAGQVPYLISRRHRFVRILWLKEHDDRQYYDLHLHSSSATQGTKSTIRQIAHLCVDVCDLFDCAAIAGAPVLCGYDTTVGTLAEFLDELIFRVDYEGGIESGERVSLHGLSDEVTLAVETVLLVLVSVPV